MDQTLNFAVQQEVCAKGGLSTILHIQRFLIAIKPQPEQ